MKDVGAGSVFAKSGQRSLQRGDGTEAERRKPVNPDPPKPGVIPAHGRWRQEDQVVSEDYPQLQSELETSLVYIRPCLKTKASALLIVASSHEYTRTCGVTA